MVFMSVEFVKFAIMSKVFDSLKRFWYLRFANPVVRKGEHGAYKWEFRRFWMEIETVSGNFKARFMADEHPYGYLMSGKDDANIIGFCQTLYYLGKTVTSDQGLVDDIQMAFRKYETRIGKKEAEQSDERIDMEYVRGVQEYAEMDKKERRRYERDVNGRFKKVVKEAR